MAPVVYVHVSSEENKVFSMSADNSVKVSLAPVSMRAPFRRIVSISLFVYLYTLF